MSRCAVIVRLAMLMIALSTAGMPAEETDGIVLAPEVLSADDAQGRVLDQLLGKLQLLEQLRFLNPSGAAIASSNLASPAVAPFNSNLQALESALIARSQAAALRRRRKE